MDDHVHSYGDLLAMKVLLAASTFPSTDTDPIPGFVKEQVIALKRIDPQLQFSVLAPHYGNLTNDVTEHLDYTEHRFTYFLPRHFQSLAGQGIVPALEAKPARWLLVPFFFFFEFLALLRLTRKWKPDLLYAHWFTPQGITCGMISLLTGVPYVLTTHANDVRIWRIIPVLGPAVVRFFLRRAKKVTAVSEGTRQRMREFFSPSEWAAFLSKTQVIPMGIHTTQYTSRKDTSWWRSQEGEEVGHKGSFRILFLGRLASKKGIEFLIKAVARIPDPDIHLWIAGTGPLLPSLQEQVHTEGLQDRTTFLGYVTGREKVSRIAAADLVIVPSIETTAGDVEGFPVVIMEAMAAGKICVATDASGADALITHGDSGFLVPQKDAVALAEQIQIIRHMRRMDLHKISRKARSAAAFYDWSHIATKHSEFLFSRPLLP